MLFVGIIYVFKERRNGGNGTTNAHQINDGIGATTTSGDITEDPSNE